MKKEKVRKKVEKVEKVKIKAKYLRQMKREEAARTKHRSGGERKLLEG